MALGTARRVPGPWAGFAPAGLLGGEAQHPGLPWGILEEVESELHGSAARCAGEFVDEHLHGLGVWV